jgi:aldehyde:ferredoxin oxidoreductase
VARIHASKKAFNIREGWRTSDDWLPPRLLNEPLASGPARGTTLSADELRGMIRGYYEARGWDDGGFIPEARMAELESGAR